MNKQPSRYIVRLILLVALLAVGLQAHIALADDPYKTWADEALGMRFQYPSSWGVLRGTMNSGDTGYIYRLSARLTPYGPDPDRLIGGGISRDFTEGRGGWYTDYAGFRGHSISGVCRDFEARMCLRISNRAVFMVALPSAVKICTGQVRTNEPIILIALNLPRNITVKGFVFAVPLLSATKSAELLALLGTGSNMCTAENQRAFDAHITKIYRDILRGTLDAETGQTYREMRYLARSIRFWR